MAHPSVPSPSCLQKPGIGTPKSLELACLDKESLSRLLHVDALEESTDCIKMMQAVKQDEQIMRCKRPKNQMQ